jgi:hypothetical protein
MTYPGNGRDLEAPEADAVEQATAADPSWDDDPEASPATSPLEASEWDAQEQGRTVPVEDDYR